MDKKYHGQDVPWTKSTMDKMYHRQKDLVKKSVDKKVLDKVTYARTFIERPTNRSFLGGLVLQPGIAFSSVSVSVSLPTCGTGLGA